MARSAVRKIEEPPRRKFMDLLIFAGIAIVLLFALVGLASAGIFVAGKVSGGSKTHHTSTGANTHAGTSREVAAAQVQATQIVRAARAAEHSIVTSITARANRRARAIIKSAQQAAARTRAAAASAASNAASTSSGSAVASSPPTTSSGATTSSGTTTGAATGSTGTTSSSGTGSFSSSTGAATTPPSSSVQTYATPVAPVSSTPANLIGLPASWKVVAYNASFGSGPGSAGSITVTNRSARTFSGTARVAYTGGGSAMTSFQGLAPGQTVVLPLNGTAYPGRGFHIEVLGVH